MRFLVPNAQAGVGYNLSRFRVEGGKMTGVYLDFGQGLTWVSEPSPNPLEHWETLTLAADHALSLSTGGDSYGVSFCISRDPLPCRIRMEQKTGVEAVCFVNLTDPYQPEFLVTAARILGAFPDETGDVLSLHGFYVLKQNSEFRDCQDLTEPLVVRPPLEEPREDLLLFEWDDSVTLSRPAEETAPRLSQYASVLSACLNESSAPPLELTIQGSVSWPEDLRYNRRLARERILGAVSIILELATGQDRETVYETLRDRLDRFWTDDYLDSTMHILLPPLANGVDQDFEQALNDQIEQEIGGRACFRVAPVEWFDEQMQRARLLQKQKKEAEGQE